MADNRDVWENHYTRPKARQAYPDENVVRVLKKEFTHEIARGTALDLGSGSGRHLDLLREHFSRTLACDFSCNSLRLYASENFGALQAALPELPFMSQAFDFILCWGVLHYLPEGALKPAIAEIYRILKPGGKIFLTLRSDSDTHLKAQLAHGDLKDGHAGLFSKTETLSLFQEFSRTSYGFIARQPLGEEHIVAHHMILAQK
jgi:SAM-dependent methyltransferase